jgi:hypothetical protein
MKEGYRNYCLEWVMEQMRELTSQGVSARKAAGQVSGLMWNETSAERIRKIWAENNPRPVNEADRKEVEREEAEKAWPLCKKCQGKKVEKNYRSAEPNTNGLCRSCRRREKQAKEDEAAKRKFEETPIDKEAETFWQGVAEQLEQISNGGIPVGKIGQEVLFRVEAAQKNINLAVHELFTASLCHSESG